MLRVKVRISEQEVPISWAVLEAGGVDGCFRGQLLEQD